MTDSWQAGEPVTAWRTDRGAADVAAEVEVTTVFEWVIIPGIQPWDDQAGEPADLITGNVPILFALVAAGGPEPAEADYVAGEWTAHDGGYDGRFSVGSDPAAAVKLSAAGVFDIYCAVDGTQVKPRRRVGQLVVS